MILGEAAGFPRYPPHRWLSGSQLIQSKGAGTIASRFAMWRSHPMLLTALQHPIIS